MGDVGEQSPGPRIVAGTLVEVGQCIPPSEVVDAGTTSHFRGPLEETYGVSNPATIGHCTGLHDSPLLDQLRFG